MLGRLETMSLNSNMTAIAAAIEHKDWAQMKLKAHCLKGACGYVGASRLHYACYFLQEAHQRGQYNLMLEKYPRLVEAVIEFKRYSRRILAEHKGKQTFEVVINL